MNYYLLPCQPDHIWRHTGYDSIMATQLLLNKDEVSEWTVHRADVSNLMIPNLRASVVSFQILLYHIGDVH